METNLRYLNAAKVLKSTVVGEPFQAFITPSLKNKVRVPIVIFFSVSY